jgi:creatinine amidohydrolase
LTRTPGGPGTYSPTGSWGDPTLATRAKGERLVRALVDALIADVEALRAAPLP